MAQPCLECPICDDVAEPADEHPTLHWIAASDNPWGVPLLDVRPVTLGMASASADRQCVANLMQLGHDDGLGFVGQAPVCDGVAPADLRFPVDRVLAPGVLFVPTEMEHKWAIYFHDGRLVCVRSWTHEVRAVARVETRAGLVRVTEIRGKLVAEDESPAFTARVLDFLLHSHALDMPIPAPLPERLADDPIGAALWCRMCFGDRAMVAAVDPIPRTTPARPLRTDSLLHIAAARADTRLAARQLAAGVPVDLLSHEGGSALHWALARDDTRMAAFLLEHGSPVDVRSSTGATPLMAAARDGRLDHVAFLLARGADPNAHDHRGSTALQHAAEAGHQAIVKRLLAHGVTGHPAAVLLRPPGRARR